MIYHYCNLDALISILKNQIIWASNYKYLNDSTEIQSAIDVIEKNIDLIESGFVGVKGRIALFRSLKRAMSGYDYYITSFSKKADVLSQWRGYAQNGRGVCIGFDEKCLEELGFDVLDVIYGRQELINEIVERAKQFLTDPPAKRDKIKLEVSFAKLIARYKSTAFIEENEKRLISVYPNDAPPGNLNFRRSGNFIAPYLEVSFKPKWENIVEEIWIGPSQKDDDTKRSVLFMKNYLGYFRASLRTSAATFRD